MYIFGGYNIWLFIYQGQGQGIYRVYTPPASYLWLLTPEGEQSVKQSVSESTVSRVANSWHNTLEGHLQQMQAKLLVLHYSGFYIILQMRQSPEIKFEHDCKPFKSYL